MACGIRLCEEVADRDELPLWQERVGYGKSALVAVGEAVEAFVDGDCGVRISAHAIGPVTADGVDAAMAPAMVVPPKRQAVPRSLDTALPVAFSS